MRERADRSYRVGPGRLEGGGFGRLATKEERGKGGETGVLTYHGCECHRLGLKGETRVPTTDGDAIAFTTKGETTVLTTATNAIIRDLQHTSTPGRPTQHCSDHL